VENKTVEMVVKDLLLADNRKKKKKMNTTYSVRRAAKKVSPKVFLPFS